MARDKLRVGIIGGTDRRFWGARGHIPAIKVLPELDLVAICTAHEETAKSAAERHEIGRWFTDYREMAKWEGIDMVAVAVRISLHYPMAVAALEAGKHVYCEWPLTTGSALDDKLTAIANASGLKHALGLQARGSPSLHYVRDLLADGYVGEPLTFQMTEYAPLSVEGRPSDRYWMAKKEEGGSALSIAAGHSLDIVTWSLGEIDSVCGSVDTLVKQWRTPDTGELVSTDTPDTVSATLRMRSGAVGSVHVTNAAWFTVGFRMVVFGTKGKLTVETPLMPQYSPASIEGRRVGSDVAEVLTVPERYCRVDELNPQTMAYNVAQVYRRLASAIRTGTSVDPDFSRAAPLHRLLEALERSSEERTWVELH